MKAVKAFKRLLERKRPERMTGILGRGTQLVQPPQSMLGNSNSPPHSRHAKSVDTEDRRPIEQALTAEGIHRDIDLSSLDNYHEAKQDISAPMSRNGQNVNGANQPQHAESSTTPSPKRSLNAHPRDHRPKGASSDGDHGKGHAHNPLEDHLFLAVGAGGSDEAPDPPAVSESPAAAEWNIYETAYDEEIERIRSRSGTGTTLYLTRRVEKKKEYQEDEHLVGTESSAESQPKGGLSKVLGLVKAREKRRGEEK